MSLRSLRKEYGDVVAVDDVSLEIRSGEFLTLLGPSGSGKTSTLLMVAGFVHPTSGDILIDGMSVADVQPEKRNVGVVFQSYALFPHMTVLGNLAFPLEMRRRGGTEIERRVREVLELVQLKGLERRYPSQLSGGQQQRVALARAVIFDPPVLLMDEPLGALDKKLREHLQIELRHLQRRLGVTVISVTHDQNEALTMSDRIAVMNAGRVEQVGSPTEVYEEPGTLFVADFLGESNTFRGKVVGHEADATVVECDRGAVVRCRASTLAPGERVVVMIRPERLTMAPATDPAERLRGALTETVYAGDITRYWLEVAGLGTLSAKSASHSYAAGTAAGSEVAVSWRPSHARLFTDGGNKE